MTVAEAIAAKNIYENSGNIKESRKNESKDSRKSLLCHAPV